MAKKKETRWTMGMWHELPQWRCTACAWDTLDGEDAMVAHWNERHAVKAPKAVGPPVVKRSRYGNVVADK